MKTFLLSFLTFVFATSISAQSVKVSWATTHQTMDGFGASTGYVERNPNLTPSQADCFFSATNASCDTGNSIGLEWIRIQDSEDGTSTPDLTTLRLAVARGAKVFISFDFEYSFTSANWPSMTSYIIAKIQYLQSNGVPVAYLSPQNEPENNSSWTASILDQFTATSLVPGLTAAGLSIPIVLGEDSNWFRVDYVTPCMNDSSCTPYVPVVAGHAYGSGSVDGFPAGGYQCCTTYVPVPSSAAGKRVWQTEVNGGFSGPCASDSGLASYDPSMTDALVYAHNIHDFLTVANGSAWMFWNLQAQTAHGSPDCNDGITDSNFNPAKRFYAIGNWSKFVRSGWVRIDATASPASRIYVTAFKEGSSGNFAIVAVNQNSSPANVNFSLSGFPSVASVTPTLTSASVNLVDQATASVSSGFSYLLPANSVITFHGVASSTPSSSNPSAPNGLTAAVQ
jgi:glucuronoarabinoxylan endo-1,4-beta-xylanase